MSARATAAATPGDSVPLRAGGLLRLLTAAVLLAAAAMQGGCAGSMRNGPINAALAGPSEASPSLEIPGGNFEDTVVGLSFSGGEHPSGGICLRRVARASPNPDIQRRPDIAPDRPG